MDDEVPGSVRADTAAAALQDLLPPQQQPGAPLQPLLISITVLKHSAPENSQSFIPAARA
jgi:streptomycin 6-kinase